jgi:transcriptional regulator with XRE-family HTH domain
VAKRRHKKKGPELLAAWLEKNGTTLSEFADKVDCSKQTVGALKNGAFPPGLALAVRIEKETKIPVASWVE